MGTNLIAETDHIVFLPGHGPGVMIYVPDQLFHFFPVPFPRLSVLVIRLSLGPDKRRHGKGLPFPVSQYFGGLQIIQNAVVGSSSPAQGTKARPTHSRRRTNQPDTGSRNGRIMLHQAEQTTGSPGYGSFAARTVHSFLQRNQHLAVTAVLIRSHPSPEHIQAPFLLLFRYNGLSRPAHRKGLTVRS